MARKSSFLWAIPPLVLAICGSILAVYYFQISHIKEGVFRSLTGKISGDIETQFNGFVEPITNNLLIARQWGEDGTLDIGDPDSLDSRFIPVLGQFRPISAVCFGRQTSGGLGGGPLEALYVHVGSPYPRRCRRTACGYGAPCQAQKASPPRRADAMRGG